jgi:hypothetical protein
MKIYLGPTERNQGGKSGAFERGERRKKWRRRREVVVVTIGAGTRVALEGELANAVLDILGLELLLGQTDPGHLGVSVDDRRDDVVVNVTVAACVARGTRER